MNITEVLITIAIAILYLTPLVILIAAICAVINIIFSKGQNKRSKLYLVWTFFPFILPRFAKKYGYLKKFWKQWLKPLLLVHAAGYNKVKYYRYQKHS